MIDNFNWVSVESSTIAKVQYIESVEKLYIAFKGKNGCSVYRYDNFKKEEYENLLNAESKGKYFHENIKPNYEFVKVATLDEMGVEYKLPKGTKDEITDKVLKEAVQNMTLGIPDTALIKLNALISFRETIVQTD